MPDTLHDPELQAFLEDSLRRTRGPADAPPPAPALCYVICATPRCGSNLLCEALSLTGFAGAPLEYFEAEYRRVLSRRAAPDSGTMAFDEYFRRVLVWGTGANGVFGAKVMWSYLESVVGDLTAVVPGPDTRAAAVLARAFPNLRYVSITRADKIRQAISLAKAVQSAQWVSSGVAASDGHDERLAYDFDQIAVFASMLARHDREWEAFFDAGGIRPYRVTYEQFVITYEQTVRGVLAWLGLAQPEAEVFGRRKIARMASGINDDWHARFVEDAQRPSWKLELHEGSAAQVTHLTTERELMRVDITCLPARVPWYVKLRRAPLTIVAGHNYVLGFRVRADAPRRIGWAVGQAHAPWAHLCAYAELDVTTDWHAVECPFVASASEEDARIFFDLGTGDSAVELSTVVLRDVSADSLGSHGL